MQVRSEWRCAPPAHRADDMERARNLYVDARAERTSTKCGVVGRWAAEEAGRPPGRTLLSDGAAARGEYGSTMLANPQTFAPQGRVPGRLRSSGAVAAIRSFLLRLLLHAAALAAAAVAFAAYEHFKLQGATNPSYFALGAAVVLGLAPVRAILHELLAIEGTLLHLVHGAGGLAVAGLTLGGVVSGRPALDRVSLAPFALMGAAQSLTHQPRNAEQGAAFRRFATTLPQVRQLTRSGAFGSPSIVRQSIAVLTSLVGQAQALGETELRSDPAFQGALKRATLRVGLSLGLDSADEALKQLAANPAAASVLPDLRKRLAAARLALDAGPGVAARR